MTARYSISLTDDAERRLNKIVDTSGAKTSDIIEAAVRLFSMQDAVEIRRALVMVAASKKVSTAAGWRAIFWKTLAEALGVTSFVYDSRRPYGPFQFNGCQVIFLLPNMSGTEDGSLTVHIFEAASLQPNMHHESTTNHYLVEDSVLDAVDDAITWIAAHGDSRVKASE